eukprot:30317_1
MAFSIIRHDESVNYILCPICGVPMKPNDRNICLKCLSEEIDITADILQKNQKLSIKQCDSCKRFYDKSILKWKTTEIGSPDLRDMLLRKIKGLHKKGNKIVQSSFLSTESHSKQIIIEIQLQHDVVFDANDTLKIDKTFTVSFKIHNETCGECQVSSDLHSSWKSCVQIRQPSDIKHHRLFFFLEQLLIKHHHKSFTNCTDIQTAKQGFDFYFDHIHMARLFMTHVKEIIAINTNIHKQIAANKHNCAKNNIQKYKSTLYGELPSISNNDLCLIPAKLQKKCGGHSPLMVCYKISSSLHFMDPSSSHKFELDAKLYFRNAFKAIASVDKLCVFYVVNVSKDVKHGNLWEIELVRECDLGVNDEMLECVTPLEWIKEGDMVQGYDVNKLSNTTDLGDQMKRFGKKNRVPDVIIIQKYDERLNEYEMNKRKRKWKLKRIDAMNDEMIEMDYQTFLNQLQLHKHIRAQINIYKNEEYTEQKENEDLDGIGAEELIHEVPDIVMDID